MPTARTQTQRRRDRRPGFLDGLSDEQRRVYDRIPEKVEYVWDPLFEGEAAERTLYGPDAEIIDAPDWASFTEVADGARPNGRGRKRLSAGDEATLFRRYNYARYRLSELIEMQGRRKSLGRAREMVFWYGRALGVRATLVRANLPLVLAMAKRTRIPNVEFTELVSEGNMALLRSVEKFDASRGYKFSTYACRAILKGFNRLATKTSKHRQRFPTEFDPDLERSDYDVRKRERQREDSLDALREVLARNRANLTDTERTVVMERFAIVPGGKGKTLTEVGKMVGLTTERVRQIQNLALSKLRLALDEEYLVA
jgi:RNA polymerase sigma factor (sigma-70 family)